MVPINGKVTLALLSILAMICSVALYAATLTLTPAAATDAGCGFTDYTRDATGNLTVTCDVGVTTPGVTLTGDSKTVDGCEYANYTRAAGGNLAVTCVDTLPVPPVLALTAPLVAAPVAPPPPPPPPPPSGCNIQPEDIPAGCTVREVTWGTQVSVGCPTCIQPIDRNQDLAFCVTMPDRSGGSTPSGIVNASVGKLMTLSQLPCDFSPALLDNYCVAIGSPNLTLQNSSLTTLGPGVCVVTTGATYFFNVRNSTNYPPVVTTGANDTCSASSPCDSFFLPW